ncbi:MAG TPA: glycosyltransferase [Verrucomicrobiae bacterium]|nr:glycosyltransferase [Verrucomicrobiae bacterium]
MITESPIRILHLMGSWFIGGPEKQILQHAADLNSPECEMIVGSFRNGNGTPDILLRAKETGLRTLELPPGRFNPRTVFALAKYLREEKITLLCTHTYKANVTGFLASPLAGCTQIGFVRGWLAETWKVRQYEALDRLVLSHMKWVACVSRPQAELLKSRRGKKREPFVIPNAALLLAQHGENRDKKGELRRSLGLPEECLLVGAIGRFSIEKGHRFLLEAMKAVIAKQPRTHLVLLGEGRERENLEGIVVRLGLQASVTFPGFQSNIIPWIRACDVVANPSLTEGTPNVVLEAMAVGTPVVATAVGGVPDVIEDAWTGHLVAAGDVNALAGAIIRTLDDPAATAEMAERAYRKVTQDFSPLKQRQLLVAMYEEVLSPLSLKTRDIKHAFSPKDPAAKAITAGDHPSLPASS